VEEVDSNRQVATPTAGPTAETRRQWESAEVIDYASFGFRHPMRVPPGRLQLPLLRSNWKKNGLKKGTDKRPAPKGTAA
jgi:hypothetical protein